MQLSELQDEVQARGFDYLSDTRLNYFLNRAMHRACEREAWPFLEATATGASPLTIADMRAVLSVADTTTETVLSFEDYRTLRDDDPALSTTGSPYCWYQSAATEITAYPTDTSTSLDVRYISVPDDLSNASDTPPFPSRFHYMLVDGACALAYADSDNPDQAQVCQDNFERALVEMGDSLLVVNYDSARGMVVTTASGTDW